MKFLTIPIFLVVLTVSNTAMAETVEEKALSYIEAFNSRDKSISEFIAPAELKRFHKIVGPIVIRDSAYREVWLGDISESDARKLSSAAIFDLMNNEKYIIDNHFYTEVEVIGTLLESNTKAHVVLKRGAFFGDPGVKIIDVISLSKSNGEWKLHLSKDFNDILKIISA